MAKVTVVINTDNDAFYMNETVEVARILQDLAWRLNGHPNFSPGLAFPLRDHNGNEVGYINVDSTHSQ